MPFTLKKVAMRLRNNSEYIPLPGVRGEDGADGVSPAVSFTTITGGHTMTVTDKAHPTGQTINIMDGSGGGGGTSDYTDLTNKPSINNVTLSGNKTTADLGLTSPVQSVNGKTGAVVLNATDVDALPNDTAIPSKTSDLINDSGFLTSAPVTSVNNKTGAVTLTASDVGAGTYSKPSGGIPQSDLASAVQTSLNKADTALQSVPSAYRTAADQDEIDDAQNAQIEALAGSLATIESSHATAAHAVGDYIVYNGQLYKVTAAIAAGETLTVGTNIVATTTGDQLSNIEANKMDKVVLTAGTTWNFYSAYGYITDNNATSIVITIPVTTQVSVTRAVTLTRCTGSLRSSLGIIGGYSFDFLPYVTTCEIYSSGRGLHIEITKSDGFGISGVTTFVGYMALTFAEDL